MSVHLDPRRARDLWSLLRLTVVALLVSFGWQLLTYLGALLPLPVALVSTAIMTAVILRVHGGLWRRDPGAESYRASMRIRPVRKRAVLLLPPVVAAAMAAAVSSALVWSHLMELPIDRESELMKRVQSEPFGWLKMGMLMVVVGPLIEELMIRGRIQTALENRLGRAPGILIAALVFSLAHFDAVKVPSLLVIGIVLGTAVSFTGSVWMGVALHAANNGLAMVLESVADLSNTSDLRTPVLVLSLSLLALIALGVVLWRIRADRKPPATEPSLTYIRPSASKGHDES